MSKMIAFDEEATLDKVQGARSVVGADGVVHVVQPNGTVKKIVAGVVSDEGRIEGIADLSTAVLTAVGDSVVVLDKAGSTVRTPKGTVPVTGADKLVPQLPGPAALQPAGGRPRPRPDAGVPVAAPLSACWR